MNPTDPPATFRHVWEGDEPRSEPRAHPLDTALDAWASVFGGPICAFLFGVMNGMTLGVLGMLVWFWAHPL